MESKSLKVTGSSSGRIVVDLKRKRTAQGETRLTGATQVALPLHSTSNSSIGISGKRRKFHGSGASSSISKFLIKNYLKFKEAGAPQRLMYYHHGEWTDYPQDFVALVKEDLLVKKATVEVEFNGDSIILDFLHMMRLDLQTGLQQPLAWIDEFGNCFFPEVHANCEGENGDEEGFREQVTNPLDTTNFKLQVEIQVNGSDCSNLKESSGESNTLDKKIEDDKNPAGIPAAEDEVDKTVGKTQHVKNLPWNEVLDEIVVRKLFMKGMGEYADVDVVDIYRGSGPSMDARFELFQKQAEITEKLRGDSNVRYAWFPLSKEEIRGVMMFGLGHSGTGRVESTFGAGVHLFPDSCSQISARYCDVDENGARHVLLCRVIMGSMERVHPGSKQFHPSSEEFDNGVDDLQHPGHYVVWNMNVNTHIFPQYVLTFRVPSGTEGFPSGKAVELALSGASTCSQGPQVQLDLNSTPPDAGNDCRQPQVQSSQDSVENMGSSSTRAPKSPWMPFHMLFAAIANKVASKDMNMIMMDYELFKRKMTSREEFVKKLRLVVGDQLLRCAIMSLQGKEPPKTRPELKTEA